MKKYHKELDSAKWIKYTFTQQILMIANEMNRLKNCYIKNDFTGIDMAFKRVLELTDLTIEIIKIRNRRKELLRWKELLLLEYTSKNNSYKNIINILKTLLLFNSESAKQIKYLIN